MLASPSLLITDDDRDFRETLRSIFEPNGFATLLAADGEQAIRIVADRTVHVVLMDLHMPRMSGAEALVEIKRINWRLPCIVISAGLDARDWEPRDAFAVLGKPITRAEVTHAVEVAMRVTYNWPPEDGRSAAG